MLDLMESSGWVVKGVCDDWERGLRAAVRMEGKSKSTESHR